jgi:hypothetical protein
MSPDMIARLVAQWNTREENGREVARVFLGPLPSASAAPYEMNGGLNV